jgi:alcohol dehydrogenase
MTGVGAVVNTARVPAGASVVVFGMGGVGLSAVMGAKAAGAAIIVAVDLSPKKLELAKSVGATAVVDARQADASAAIREFNKGGADFSFDAVGHEKVTAQAYEVTRRGGTTVAVGLAHPSKSLSINALSLVAEERTLRGSYMGSSVPARDIPRFIAMHKAGILPVEKLFSASIRLEDINQGFDLLASGETVRQVIRFGEAAAAR